MSLEAPSPEQQAGIIQENLKQHANQLAQLGYEAFGLAGRFGIDQADINRQAVIKMLDTSSDICDNTNELPPEYQLEVGLTPTQWQELSHNSFTKDFCKVVPNGDKSGNSYYLTVNHKDENGLRIAAVGSNMERDSRVRIDVYSKSNNCAIVYPENITSLHVVKKTTPYIDATMQSFFDVKS
jgi:hypothetical protein